MSKEKSLVVDNIQSLEELISSVKEAQRIFSTYSQEQVDKIFTAAALAANKARIPLAKMAVKETGMGIVEDKVIKNHYAAEYIYNAYRDTKTCGVIEEDKAAHSGYKDCLFFFFKHCTNYTGNLLFSLAFAIYNFRHSLS